MQDLEEEEREREVNEEGKKIVCHYKNTPFTQHHQKDGKSFYGVLYIFMCRCKLFGKSKSIFCGTQTKRIMSTILKCTKQ